MGRIQPEANRDMLVDHVAMGMFGTMLVDHVTSGRFGPNPPTLKGKIEGRKDKGEYPPKKRNKRNERKRGKGEKQREKKRGKEKFCRGPEFEPERKGNRVEVRKRGGADWARMVINRKEILPTDCTKLVLIRTSQFNDHK